jgi:hypothetical protein
MFVENTERPRVVAPGAGGMTGGLTPRRSPGDLSAGSGAMSFCRRNGAKPARGVSMDCDMTADFFPKSGGL